MDERKLSKLKWEQREEAEWREQKAIIWCDVNEPQLKDVNGEMADERERERERRTRIGRKKNRKRWERVKYELTSVMKKRAKS